MAEGKRTALDIIKNYDGRRKSASWKSADPYHEIFRLGIRQIRRNRSTLSPDRGARSALTSVGYRPGLGWPLKRRYGLHLWRLDQSAFPELDEFG